MHDAPKIMIPETQDRGRRNSKTIAQRRTTLLNQRDELDSILLSLRERARSNRSVSHPTTNRVAEIVIQLKKETLEELRRW